LHIIRQMVAQLNLPVHIIGGETVRAADGLALSSRNQYLDATQRGEATFLYQTLQGISRAVMQGERDFEQLQQQAVEALTVRGWRVDYVAVRNQSDLQPASPVQGNLARRALVILAAAWLGNTRLLDNVEVNL
jgi:pantoate--beta-alanine ligase